MGGNLSGRPEPEKKELGPESETEMEEEDVIHEKSELGKYEQSEEVRSTFQNVGGGDACLQQCNSSAIVPVSSRPVKVRDNRIVNYLFRLIQPSHETTAIEVYQKFLEVFPGNSRILANIDSLKSTCGIVDRERYLKSRYLSNCIQLLCSPQVAQMYPVLGIGRALLPLLLRYWKNSIELRTLVSLQSLVFDVKKCWNHLKEINEAKDPEDRELTILVESLANILLNCLVSFSDRLTAEAKAIIPHTTLLDDLTSTSSELISFNLLLNTCKTPCTPTFTEMQNLTELVFEQAIDFGFKLCSIYCWTGAMVYDPCPYKPEKFRSSVMELNSLLDTEFWSVCNKYSERLAARISEMAEREATIQINYTPHAKLLSTTRLLRDKLNTALIMLNDIESLASLGCKNLGKSDILYMKRNLAKELSTVQTLAAMEINLIGCMAAESTPPTSNHSSPESTSIDSTLEPDEVPDDESEDSRTSFESEVEQNLDRVHDADVERKDEVYELDSRDAIQESEDVELQEVIIESSTVIAQKVMMNQLKDTLKPRREQMRTREREAYFRNYNRYPEDDDEEDEENEDEHDSLFELVKFAKRHAPSGYQSSDDDEVVQEESDTDVTSISERLNKILSGNKDRIDQGLVPIQRADSPTSNNAEQKVETKRTIV